MKKPYDILVVGDYCLDLVFTGLSKFPEPGLEIVARQFEMIPGGAYNTAVTLHRLGLLVGWAADFGDDDYSRYVLERISSEGLDQSLFIHHHQAMRRITIALSSPQDRAFIAYYDPEPSLPAAVKAIAAHKAQAIYIAGLYHGSALDLGLRLVRTKKMKLVMDGNCEDGISLSDNTVRKAIGAVDVFLPNTSEICRLTGSQDWRGGIQALVDLCPLVVVKDGEKGAYACSKSGIIRVPGIPIQPVDTTGAGDCFDAGFLSAWLKGLPVKDCLQWGNIVGGLSTLALGGTGHSVREADVLDWVHKMRLSGLWSSSGAA